MAGTVNKHLEKNIGKDKKSIAYSLEFEAQDKTLTDEEINDILNKIMQTLEKQGMEIRSTK